MLYVEYLHFFLNALGATNIPGSEGWKEKMNRRR